MKIGIFGGSFNPPHKMHKDIALNLINNGYLDKVIFVPVGDNYDKKDLANFTNRINMLKIIFQDIPNIEVSNLERNGKKYTYETLDYFKSIYPNDEIYFICGSDNLSYINTWKNYKYILENYKILVIERDGYFVNDIIDHLNLNKNIIFKTNIEMCTLSSTYIRGLINENKIDKLIDIVDEKVLKYIITNNLYKNK